MEYNEGRITGARKLYNEAIGFAMEEKNHIKNFEKVLNDQVTVEYFKILAILFANMAQTELKLENYPRALLYGIKGEKKLKKIKEILGPSRSEDYTNKFKALEVKIKHRVEEAWKNLPSMIRFFHHSAEPVQELRVGSLLTHNNHQFGGGIFHDSVVFMTEFNRE